MIAASSVVFLAVGSGACAHRYQPDARKGADSVSGVVSVTGTSFEQRVMLKTPAGSIHLAGEPADSSALVRVGGTTVTVYGRTERDGFRVTRFVVTSVGGHPVVDGVLNRDDRGFVLETINGNVPLGNPPLSLRPLIGARVWVGGLLVTGPNDYGVIVPPS